MGEEQSGAGVSNLMAPEKPANGNEKAKLLTTLAQSPNQWVQLATVGLVAMSGIGNWAATWNSSDRNKSEIEISRQVAFEGQQRIREEARRQIDDIHKWMGDALDEFHRGNADSAANRKILAKAQDQLVEFERRQTIALENQVQIVKTQGQILTEVREMVEQFDKFKRGEQMRGAPP
jgi:hypothetical protein